MLLLFTYFAYLCRGFQQVITMATTIKAIPTLKGKEAKEFLRHAEEAERNYKGYGDHDQHPYCQMAKKILQKAGML